MIGYDPNGLMIDIAHRQKICDALMACTTDTERDELEAKLVEHSKAVVLEKTGIKVGSKVVVCLSEGISLMGGMEPIHDHDDPDQHVTVEVTRIDCWGSIYYNDQAGEEHSTHIGMITLCEE